MDKRYKHLNGGERGVILAEHRRGASLGAIGLLPGCRAFMIGRDLGVAVRRETPPSRIARSLAGTDSERAASGVDGG